MADQSNQLKQAIQHFHGEFTPSLQTLAELLNEACISHYSSGRGAKRITLDIFPASNNVHALISMVSLDRPHNNKSGAAYKDFSKYSSYNPAKEFIQYLSRWTEFAEEIMQYEGDTARGIAAAQAKIIMNELIIKLSPQKEGRVAMRGAKLARVTTPMDFFTLMEHIGRALEEGAECPKATTLKKNLEQNYKKALAAANKKLKCSLLTA